MSTAAAAARPVFFVSDGTAITAETLGSALLVSFPGVPLDRHTIPFVDTADAAAEAVATITDAAHAAATDAPPLVFTTIRDLAVRQRVAAAPAIVIDLLGGHLREVEAALGVSAQPGRGTVHSLGDLDRYHDRMWAIEYAIEHDDGQSLRALDRAQVILIAPSRCGKTPTSMYLALQHGIVVANYPLTDDDLPEGRLPSDDLPRPLRPYADRLFGLTANPQRLAQVRAARRPESTYSSLAQCTREVRWAEDLYRRHGVPSLDSTDRSVEEMAAVILASLRRRTASEREGAQR
ncbi:MAG: pyruvate, phosphate dikinase/phosphoenolpyruvate synthase regulator [Microcella sp.]|uniref:pyruvate, phosphate dikinase/phosphoenolpyruvate synthase regulator n=1 Tax=Microcella sp. TaxID=1913979 RepID=UPI0024CAA5A5|nr:pyruvate, phosphate dikinase/phosphoenolpyruvate synthase regulator [Microcella sp.]UYN82512.1 MAG: pyruvate, phosphate dikinase/phosphoenolpyruvate synthase regulator [Microcella sp.]